MKFTWYCNKLSLYCNKLYCAKFGAFDADAQAKIDIMLEEICEKEEVAEEEDETKNGKKAEAEKESAEKMRL